MNCAGYPSLPPDRGISVIFWDGEEIMVDHDFRTSALSIHNSVENYHHWKLYVSPKLMMSVVRGPGTYGYSNGLYEIAFLDLEKNGFSNIFEAAWHDQVLGYLTEREVFDWYRKAKDRSN